MLNIDKLKYWLGYGLIRTGSEIIVGRLFIDEHKNNMLQFLCRDAWCWFKIYIAWVKLNIGHIIESLLDFIVYKLSLMIIVHVPED